MIMQRNHFWVVDGLWAEQPTSFQLKHPFTLLRCPPKFIRIIKKLHSDTYAKVIIDGELSDPIAYNCGVKQGCKLAPTLFGIYAAASLYLAFKNINPSYSIEIRLRYDGDLFDLRRLKSKSKTFNKYIREAQYADDIAIFCNDAIGLQLLLSAYDMLSKKMGLRVNIEKTKTMSLGEQADFFIDGKVLERVDRFKYLGSWVTNDCKLDFEITARIQAASCAVGRLKDRVFKCRDLTTETKLKVYNQCYSYYYVWKRNLHSLSPSYQEAQNAPATTSQIRSQY